MVQPQEPFMFNQLKTDDILKNSNMALNMLLLIGWSLEKV